MELMNMKQALLPEVILLAPRVLSNRKPLEHNSFVGLYTNIKGEYSEGFIYLVYCFNNVEDKKDIEGWLICESTYFTDKTVYMDNKSYTIFYFKVNNSKDLESYKKYGNLFFNTDDWVNLFIFWGDLSKDIRSIYNTTIDSCLKVFDKEKGLVYSQSLAFNLHQVFVSYNSFVYFGCPTFPIYFEME